MITVDDLIAFGVWKKTYFEHLNDMKLKSMHSKDDLKRIAAYRKEQGEDPAAVHADLQAYNKAAEKECIAAARGSIQLVADALNRMGMSLEEARDKYRSG